MKLSLLPVSTRALTFFSFNFIGVVSANKSVNDATITTEIGEWRVAEVPEYVAFRAGQPMARMPFYFTKETLLSFRGRCGCYESVQVAGVTIKRDCSTKTNREIKLDSELFWASSRALTWSNTVVRSRVTFSSNRCRILMDWIPLMKATLIASALCSSALTAL